MTSDADRRNLLYVSADDSGKVNGDHVYVFAYPSGKPEGVLTGFTGPAGLCTDKDGDIFVTNYNGADVVVRPRWNSANRNAGRTVYVPDRLLDRSDNRKPCNNKCLRTEQLGQHRDLSAREGYSAALRVDLLDYFGCSYDDAGNLFVVAYDNSLKFAFAELPKGSATFTDITLDGKVKKRYGLATIRWDGKYVALGNVDTSMVYQVKVIGRAPRSSVQRCCRTETTSISSLFQSLAAARRTHRVEG